MIDLVSEITKTRLLLHKKFSEKNSFLDPEVYRLSCELDMLIVLNQKFVS